MYGGKNTLIGTSVDRREACSPDVILSKNLFFDSFPGQAGPVLETGLFYPRPHPAVAELGGFFLLDDHRLVALGSGFFLPPGAAGAV